MNIGIGLQSGRTYAAAVRSHVSRVAADGGTVADPAELDRVLRSVASAGISTSDLIMYSASWGHKTATGVSKLYEVLDTTGGRDLIQNTPANQPTITTQGGRAALEFDGTNDLLKSAAFTLNQPETVIVGAKQVTWTLGDYILDGLTITTGAIRTVTASPQIQLNAPTGVAVNSNLAVGAFGVVTAIFNGAGSSLQIDRTTATTGNAGTNNMGGVTLGAAGNNAAPSNIITTDLVIYQSADAAKVAALRDIIMSLNGL